MKKTSTAFALLAALSLQATAQAADIGLTVGVGTAGVAVHLSTPVSESFNVRLGYNGLSRSTDDSTDDVDYDLKLKLATVDALVDYFPMQGAFRLSAGLVYNGNKFEGNGRPKGNGTYTVNDHTYDASSFGSLNATVDFRKVAPYLGLGFGNAVAKNKGWGFSSDFGVLFQGTPKTSVTNKGCTASAPVCTQIATDMRAENESLHDEMKDFKFWPVVRVGVSYKF